MLSTPSRGAIQASHLPFGLTRPAVAGIAEHFCALDERNGRDLDDCRRNERER